MEKKYLENYNKEDYEKLSLTVDILIFTIDTDFNLQILLKKRDNYPYIGCWAIPGGFVGIDESIDDAAKRVMIAKAGVDNIHIEQLYTFGDKDRDPRMRIVSVSYLALMPRDSINNLDTDLSLFNLNLDKSDLLLPSLELAFDHRKIISLAIERMRGKLYYTDIALKFIKNTDKFTIYELQKIYETIEAKEHDTSNFRRYFKKRYVDTNIVEKTDELCRDFSKRPSSYYKIKNGKDYLYEK